MDRNSQDLQSKRTKIKWTSSIVAAFVIALLLAACGGGSSSSSSSEPAESTEASETSESSESSESGESAEAITNTALKTHISEAQLQNVLDEGFGPGQVKASELPRVAVDSFKVAAQAVTPALEEQLLECVNNTSCETGHGNLTVGIAETFGGNPYRVQWRAAATLQLLRYPQVKKIIYTDGEFNLQKTLSNFRSLVSQGANIIIGNMDFGAAMIPVAKEATSQGVTVVPGPQPILGATSDDVAAQVEVGACEYGKTFGETIASTAPKGTVAIYTGTVGNPFGAVWIPCAEKAISENGWTTALTGNTEWTPQGSQQAASALMAKGLTDGLLYDYTPNAFNEKVLASGETPPAQVVASVEYSFMKQWQDAAKEGHEFEAFIAASEIADAYTQVSVAIEKAEGQGSDIPLNVVMPEPVVSAKEYLKLYDPSLPESTNFNSLLPKSVIKEILGNS